MAYLPLGQQPIPPPEPWPWPQQPPTNTLFWPVRLSDEDVDRIARRVIELLDQRDASSGQD